MATKDKTKKNIVEWNPKYEVDFDSEETINGVKYFNVTCKNCSSIFKRTMSALTDKSLTDTTCETCLNIRRSEVIDKKGYDFMGAISAHYFVVCKTCKSCLIKKSCVMTSKKVICDICRVNGILKNLSINGCEFIRFYSKNASRWVVFKDRDGIVRDKKLTSVNKESFKGGTNDGKYYVYMFWKVITNEDVISDGLYFKIGISKEPKKRLKDLKLDYDFNIHILTSFNTHRDAYIEEKRLHKMFWWCKLNKTIPQIFTNKISFSARNKRGQKSWAKDGVTEWFHLPENMFNFMLRNKESFKCV